MDTLERSIYRLIISRLDGVRVLEPPYRAKVLELVAKGIGGFILFGGERDALRGFIDELQALADTPLIIASDIERGVGSQIEGATVFPSQMAVAAAIAEGDTGLFADMIRAVAEEAASVGINMPLIPVLDVNTDPKNPIVCTRAFSDTPEVVARLGKLYIQGIEASGLLSCAKHFPGHGDTSVDSHISLPVISKGLKELMDVDVRPFAEAIAGGVASVMVGHISVPALDSAPATISRKVITGLLREELGYEGLILTDALNMRALDDVKDICVKSLNAGVDILLHPADADAAAAEVIEAVRSGAVTEEIIETANERILKSGLKRVKGAGPDYSGYSGNARLSAEITDRAVTLVKGAPGLLPLTKGEGISVVIAAEEAEGDDRNASEHASLKGLLADASSLFYLNDGEPLTDISSKPAEETVVIAVFTSVAAWKGSSGIGEALSGILRELVGKFGRSIVISFGSPYVLEDFPGADVLVAAYDKSARAERSVVSCLTGEREFTGALPVNLSLSSAPRREL